MKLLMLVWQDYNFFLIALLQLQVVKKLFTALYADDNIPYFNEDSGNAIFSCDEMGILMKY